MRSEHPANACLSRRLLVPLLTVGLVGLNVTIAPRIRAASQTTEQSRSAFDVISIKRNVSRGRGGLTQTLPGRFVAANATMKMLFRPAYGVQDYQISGGPAWIDTDRYDIQATTPLAASNEDVHRMLQTLLAEQFGLMLHREKKDIPVYALVLGKNGLKLKEVPESDDPVSPKGSNPLGRSMQALADNLTRLPNVDRPVLDRTGINGRYDVRPLLDAVRSKRGNSDDSIFTAVQDFGLKLESQKRTIEVLVIDRAEKPPEN